MRASTPPMAAHLTPARARQLGIVTPSSTAGAGRKRTTRRAAARDGAVTVCHTCGLRCTGETDEARHTATARHHRYDWEIPT